MARVNLITKETADKIAASYLKNKSVHSLYVTRDGQVFYANMAHYMKRHVKIKGLEPSWVYPSNDNKEVVKEVEAEEVVSQEIKEPATSFAGLKKHFQELTEKGEIKESEWSNLKFAQLRKLYEKNKK
jgi:hypothetical protein